MVKISKVLLCGSKQAGKTSILEQLIYGNVTRDSVNNYSLLLWYSGWPNLTFQVFYPTIEDIYEANVDTDRSTKEAVRFYDLGGLTSKSKELPKQYMNGIDGYILVYSISNYESFLIMDSLKKEIDRNREKKDAVVIVIANKLDLVEERQVDFSQASNWATKEKVRLFEVSVLDPGTLAEPFIHLSSRLNPPIQKSSFPQLSMGRKTKEWSFYWIVEPCTVSHLVVKTWDYFVALARIDQCGRWTNRIKYIVLVMLHVTDSSTSSLSAKISHRFF